MGFGFLGLCILVVREWAAVYGICARFALYVCCDLMTLWVTLYMVYVLGLWCGCWVWFLCYSLCVIGVCSF